MRRGILSLLTILLLATGLLLPAAVSANEVSTNAAPLNEQSWNADAKFRAFWRCQRTGMSVRSQIDHRGVYDNNGPVYEMSLSFFMFKENTCSGQEFFGIEEHQYVTGVQIDKNYNRATVKTTFTGWEYRSETELPITIDLTWEGYGRKDISKDVETYTVDSNGVPVTMERTITDIFRKASVSGTITVGDQVYRVAAADDETAIFGFKLKTVPVS
jgi:hypothetical protein